MDLRIADRESPAAGRILALDALRGVAACTVMFYHCLVAMPAFYAVYTAQPAAPEAIVWWLAYSPLHLLWGGLEGVIVFFVLSGFVLALSLIHI